MAVQAPILVIGGGSMGAALVQGLLRTKCPPGLISVLEKSASRREELTTMFPAVNVAESIMSCGDVVVAVKPTDVATACATATAAGANRVLSIAAGISLRELDRSCLGKARVLRAMPNTPAIVGLGVSAFSPGARCEDDDVTWARGLLASVGSVIEVPEPMLDAFTGLFGSGPAYVFYFAEALRDAAIAEGFDIATSADLVAQLLVGAAALLERDPANARLLRERVTSPNGTTAAGVSVLEDADVKGAIAAAVRAATARSRELGNS